GHSDNLWKIEQTSMAIANGYFVGTNNRVGLEAPWNFGEFYGSSYFCNPYGEILAQGSRDKDELVVADLDLDLIAKVRARWQFFRLMRAIKAAHSVATALVPPETTSTPSTRIWYPVSASALPEMSGTPRPTLPPGLAAFGTPACFW